MRSEPAVGANLTSETIQTVLPGIISVGQPGTFIDTVIPEVDKTISGVSASGATGTIGAFSPLEQITGTAGTSAVAALTTDVIVALSGGLVANGATGSIINFYQQPVNGVSASGNVNTMASDVIVPFGRHI